MAFLTDIAVVGKIFGQKYTFSAELNVLFVNKKIALFNWQDSKRNLLFVLNAWLSKFIKTF